MGFDSERSGIYYSRFLKQTSIELGLESGLAKEPKLHLKRLYPNC